MPLARLPWQHPPSPSSLADAQCALHHSVRRGCGRRHRRAAVRERLQKKWSQPIVIENKPGGDGIVAIQAFVQANDDHVLLFAATGSFTVHPYQREKLPYDRERDLLPIARVSNTLLGIGVPATSASRR